jgi:hypothetical protein
LQHRENAHDGDRDGDQRDPAECRITPGRDVPLFRQHRFARLSVPRAQPHQEVAGRVAGAATV